MNLAICLHKPFTDGLEGQVRFKPSAYRGVFEKLQDPAEFIDQTLKYIAPVRVEPVETHPSTGSGRTILKGRINNKTTVEGSPPINIM